MNDVDFGKPPGRATNFDAASYESLKVVERGSTKLKLQIREDKLPQYYCLTWRETRRSGGNRRFYFEGGAFWTIKADTAHSMLAEAQRLNMMATKYQRWPGHSLVVRDTAKLKPTQRQVLLDETLVNGDEDLTWHRCDDIRVVACIEPWDTEVWRKVMIVSPGKNKLTFRSMTRLASYKHKYSRFILANEWKIDMSMLDADMMIYKVWLDALEDILPA